ARRWHKRQSLLAPTGSEEQPTLETVDCQVEGGEQVDVVTAYSAVDEVLGQRVAGDERQASVKIRPDVGEAAYRGFEVAKVGDKIGLSGIDHLGRRVGENSKFTQGGGERGLLLDENVQCGGDCVQRPRQHRTLGAERPSEAIERSHRLDQIVALRIEGA